jgi:guanyl-specific ribonuclease Sa
VGAFDPSYYNKFIMRKLYCNYGKHFIAANLWLLLSIFSVAQTKSITSTKLIDASEQNNNAANVFIDNIGQYGKEISKFESMGKVKYGYEGFSMPILFTPKGIIHLQRKVSNISQKEEERLEKQGVPEYEIERRRNVIDRTITMEWVGINKDVEIIVEKKSNFYQTYGLLTEKAFGYKKIIYKNAYPNIDIVYSFTPNNKEGFEYSIIAQAGADLSSVKIKYGGDVKKIAADIEGNLIIKSDIESITSTLPISYYGNQLLSKAASDIKTAYTIDGNQINFSFPTSYDKTKAIVIDPFVSSTGGLSGINIGKAKDVDFDYEGNVYVTGGGDGNAYKLSKYNAAGVLQWTFVGTTAIPSWNFGQYYGGFVVEKNTGRTYLGQGFAPGGGYRVIRISTSGLYDNYVSTGNPNFNENWKMYWNCNNNNPQILVVGGGTSSNLNLGVLTPPATTIAGINITNVPSTCCQDMVDMVFDPATNDIYSLFASLFGTPSINNKLFKNTVPYSGATIAWTVPSGYSVVQEAGNRPYLANVVVGFNDNSANVLALNPSYLFYWDGKNLKAFNKATGATVGIPLITANTALMQGGIIADACNNIFIGDGNGVIKVYNFNGSTFSDAPADITITGFPNKAVYDLAYDEAKKLIYASGDGFVGSFDVSTYCTSTTYTLNTVPNCLTTSVVTTISPAPPGGTIVTYNLYNVTTLIATNTTGAFTGLNPNITYTVTATINLACSGTQATTTFVIPGPTIGITSTNTTCGVSTGSITATGSGATAPYTYSIDGTNFFASGNFINLAAGIYTVTVKDANGCPNTTSVTITNTNGPQLSFTNTNAICGSNTGSVTANATGGTTPYQYSINNGVTYQTNNFFTGLVAGTYTLVVKDANNCINSTLVTITSSPAVFISAIPASATCGSNNGTITAFGSGGTAPLQYSINGNIYQASNVFTGITPGTYIVYVKDANGCIATTSVTVANSASPTVTATSTAALCNNINGTITATGTGGIAPYQYSRDGITFQTSNVFTGLAAGTYTITVKDAVACTNIVNITVASTGGPAVSATSTASSCTGPTGSITITATGTPALIYSINGTTFVSTNTFTGLAAGNYIAYVKDGGGCINAIPIAVTANAGPSVTAVSTPSSCNIDDGTITATGSGGTAPYTYSKDGVIYSGSNVFTGLAPGNYVVYVKDNNNCIQTTAITVLNASGLTITVSSINASCNNIGGSITAIATGNTPPLTYSLDGVTYQASNIFTGLAAGNYTVYVKDNNGCFVTKPATVVAVVGPSLTVTTINANCASSNGVIRATGSGGIAPLTYSINGSTYQASGTFINVAQATYIVYVKDATGCITTQTVTINTSGTGPGISTFTVRTSNAYPCNDNVGKIDQFRVNGVNCGACTYSINFGAFLTGAEPIWSNLAIGSYFITARDASGCTKTIIATIGVATLSTATTTVTASDCSLNNGTITLTGVGPNTPYHASINGIGGPFVDFDPTHTFTGLAAGVYDIIIADDEDFNGEFDPGNCLDTITVIVPSIGGPSIATTKTAGTCNGTNGAITAIGSGGAGGYTYNINGGAYQASGTFNNLATGIYITGVKDAANCVTFKRDTLANGSLPTFTITTTQTTCGLNNGSITFTASNGTPSYEYSINGTTFQTSNVFTGLATGTYNVYVKDALACFSNSSVSITAKALPSVTAFAVAATCNNNDGIIITTGASGTSPYTYSIDGIIFQSSNTFTGLMAGFYTITIKDASNCINTTGISVPNLGAPVIASTPVVNAKCNNPNGSITVNATGGSPTYEYAINNLPYQTNNIFSGLLPGTYTIYVKDLNGCIASKIVLVSNVNGSQTLTAAQVNSSCGLSNGSITATATGGTTPYQYSKDGVTFQVSNIFNGLAAGTYNLTVRDANLCIKVLPVTIIGLDGPVINATASPASCGLNDGTITATATGGTLAVNYSINNGAFQASNIFTDLAAGSYKVKVKDAKNCIDSINVTVTSLNFIGNLAGLTGGTQICKNGVVSAGGTSYITTVCELIDKVTPSGAVPVTGNINNCVIIDPTVQTFNAEPYVQRHFDIEPLTNANNATATITLYFKDAEFVEFNNNRVLFPPLPTVAGGGNADPAIANLRVTQYHGVPIPPHNVGNPSPGFYSINNGRGVLITPTTVFYNATYNYWEVTFPVTGFSGFYVHTNIYFPLQVSINYFTGNKQGNNHILNWKVACNSSPRVTFVLERSVDARVFNPIKTIATDSIGCLQNFNHIDTNPLEGTNYYRLKTISIDGKVTYSNIVILVNRSIDIVSIEPNPVPDGIFILKIISKQNTTAEIVITDAKGSSIQREKISIITGTNKIKQHVEKLTAGVYAISIYTNQDKSRVVRFVKR